jgi:hypothetical protein
MPIARSIYAFSRRPPFTPAPLNIATDFGAVGNGSTDNTVAINAALAAGKAQARRVLVPPGTFAYSGVLNANGVCLFGEGDASVLYSTNTGFAAIYLTGNGGVVQGLRLTGVTPTVRTPTNESRRIHAIGASNFLIDNVTIDSGSGAAIMCNDISSHGTISNNRCSNTLADSIHITDRSHHITIENNVIRNSGDDGVACVSYAPQGGLVNHITARRNDIRGNAGGRGMSVVGGSDVLYENNHMEDVSASAGMLVAQEDTYDTFAATNVVYRFNTIVNCGDPSIDHTAVLVTTSALDGPRHVNILIERNSVIFDIANVGGYRANRPDDVWFEQNVATGATPESRINFPANVTWVPYVSGPYGVQA